MTTHFSEKGLHALTFADQETPVAVVESRLKVAFLKWITYFQTLSGARRWQYLAPHGTDFQQLVWKALNQIPLGATVCYQDIAKKIGNPQASRAVGNAVAANPLLILIPCHRVVPISGKLGNYRWGSNRKLALLRAEQEVKSDLRRLFE